MDNKLIGLNINQEDYPWWYTAILGWLGMVKQIQECPGNRGQGFRDSLKVIVEKRDGRPERVYKLYDSYKLYAEAYSAGREK
jgi:hypothetical protein